MKAKSEYPMNTRPDWVPIMAKIIVCRTLSQFGEMALGQIDDLGFGGIADTTTLLAVLRMCKDDGFIEVVSGRYKVTDSGRNFGENKE